MNVGRKLMLIVVTSVALVIIPAAAGIYFYLNQNLLAAEATTLTSETQAIIATNIQTLLDYELSLKALSSTLEKTLAEPPKAGESAAFDRLVQRDPDLAWRNRREGFDGRMEAGIFLPPDALLDAEQKSLHLRSKHLLDIYGTSITSAFGNIWLLTKDRTEIIYDHLYPEFAQLMKADTDYTLTPWFTLGNPATNPKREVRWTSPMIDSTSNSWVISVVLPIDVNGHWIGTIGRDISISKALPTLMQRGTRYSGELNFLMDGQGNYIDAGPWQKQLLSNADKFKMDLTKEPELAVLLGHKESNLNTHLYSNHVKFNGREYLAIDAPMPYTDWRYTRLIPVDQILAPMRQLFYSLIGMVMAIGLLIGFLIDVAVKRNIINRLKILADAARRYGLGETKARSNLAGNDELAKTSKEFDTMIKRIETNERELNLVMANIRGTVSRVDNNQRYVFASSLYTVIFTKPMDEIIGHTMREVIGEDLYAQEEPYIKRVLAGEAVNFEIKTQVLDFGEMHGLVHFVPNFDDSNNVDGFFVNVVDMTEHKKIQQDLIERDARWKFAIEGFGDCLWDTDEIARTITYSKSWASMIGFAESELSNRLDEWESHIHPDDKATVLSTLQNCLDGKTPNYSCEYRVQCKNGSYKWILDRGIVLSRSSSGQALRMVGTASDISMRKHLADIQEIEQSRLNKIASRLRGVIYQFRLHPDGSSCFPYASEAIKQIYRVNPEEVRLDASKVFTIIHPDDYESIVASIQESAKNLTPWRAEYRVKFGDGTVRWLNGNAVPEREDGGATLWHGYIADITERKKIEQDLIESEYRWKFAIEGSGDGVWDWDIKSNTIVHSSRWKEILGYATSEEIPNDGEWQSRLHPDDKERVEESLRSYLDGKSSIYQVECRLKCKDGSYKWILGRGMVVNRDEDGKPLRMIGTHTDISERKLNEQALIESEYRSKFAIEGSGDGVWDVNVQTNDAIYSKRWAEMLGYEEGEILPSRNEWRALIHPDDQQLVLDASNAYLEGKTEIYVVEYRIKCKDGGYKWMLSRGMLVNRSEDGKPLRMIGTQIDITERKLAEEKVKRMQRELLESHERYVDLYEFAPIGYLSVTKHGMIAEVNWKVTAMFGLQRKDINQHRFEEFVSEEDKSFWRRQFTRMKELQDGEDINLTIKLTNADGSIFIANLHCLRTEDIDDQPILRVTLEDVTQLKQAEQVMQLRESYQRSLLDNFPFMVWLKDNKHRYLAVNQAFANATGHASEDLLPGLSDLEVWPREIAKKYRSDDITVLNSGVAKFSEDIIEFNGKKVWFETYRSPVTVSGNVVGTVGFARDINERKNAEMFEHFRSHILGLLIDDLTLQNILEAIVLGVEEFNPGKLCSILLLDKEGKHLTNAAAPSLPTFFNAAIDGCEIGLGVGSCGTSAFTGERVIVDEIATHPYWHDYKELAESSCLAACWSQPILAPNGKVLGTFAIYHRQPHTPSEADIKLIEQTANLASIAIERKQAEDDLRIASIAFESQEGMMVTDAKNIILKVNQAFCDITGYTSAEAVGHTPRLLSSSQHSEGFYDAMWECVHAAGHWAGEVYNRRKNGEVFPQHLTVTVVKDVNGVVTNHVATLTDITMNKAAAEEIKHLAFYDPLTGLPNRRLMVDRLNQALVFSARTGRDGAVLFLDLDHFKTLNDSLGHDVGDMLLQQVAERLVSCVREGDTVARLGGDEYVVLLEDLSVEAPEAATQVEGVGEKILAALNQAYQLGQHEYHCTPSIGVALFNNHNQSQEELLKHADIAMYQAKKAGRNTIRFFDPKMQEVINTRVDLERELRKALDKHQFHLYYQIQVDVSGRPMGAEALIRWVHPEHGLVSPFHFIPLAEETGLILPIGQWVLETACKQLKVWEHEKITQDLTLSINVSAKQFRQADFVNQIKEAVKRYDINPMLLKLELTESMLLDNIEDTVTTMNKIKEVGIRFSLDDFGTGYSSLQYLKRLPLYQLKIDQSFVRDIAVDSSDQAIVRTIIAMAHTLNLNVIAEGVETEEQQGLLLNNGCTHYQGYFYGRPVPIEQFEVMLRPQ